MKTFERSRTLDELDELCIEKGWWLDTTKYDKGSDYVTLQFVHDEVERQVVYSTFNGHFMVKEGDEIITENSTFMDGTAWYDALLQFLYVQKSESAA